MDYRKVGTPLNALLERMRGDSPVQEIRGNLTGVSVTSVCCDTRRCEPGSLFCCIAGGTRDGHDFAAEAVDRGAVAVLCSREVEVPQVQVRKHDVRAAMAEIAATLWDHPADRMTMAGVTGTNGKTTVTHLLSSIFRARGWKSTPLGTLSGPMTTPDAPELQRVLAKRVAEGEQAVAMEISSHGMAGHRVDGIIFDVAVFTNLGHDHLDFHHSIEEYFAAKAELFTPRHARAGVIGIDDSWGRRLERQSEIPVRSFSVEEVTALHMDQGGSTFELDGVPVRIGLAGRFNVANAVGAFRAAQVLGIENDDIVRGLSDLPGVPGRLERVPSPACSPTVFVDFAHTPDGLSAACAALAELAPGRRLVVVFGCGGNRDRSKRPEMGRVAGDCTDVAIVTSDNPRGEDPASIIGEIAGGFRPGSRAELRIEPDRERAIAAGIEMAGPDGILLIAGKGHETGQEMAGRRVPFDDREVAAGLLARRGTER